MTSIFDAALNAAAVLAGSLVFGVVGAGACALLALPLDWRMGVLAIVILNANRLSNWVIRTLGRKLGSRAWTWVRLT